MKNPLRTQTHPYPGELLQKYRHRAGLRQIDLAAGIEVTPKTVINWENCLSVPSPSNLKKIVSFFAHQNIFTPPLQQACDEASHLWEAVKDFYEAQPRDCCLFYPPFDEVWFAGLLAEIEATQSKSEVKSNKSKLPAKKLNPKMDKLSFLTFQLQVLSNRVQELEATLSQGKGHVVSR